MGKESENLANERQIFANGNLEKSRNVENVTIIGGIGLNMNQMFYKVVETTNKDTVENFFEKFHGKVDLCDKVIVMNNNAAHWSS